MDFFADGGFQQLFCDLNDQQNFVIWDKPLNSCNYNNYNNSNNNNRDCDSVYTVKEEAAPLLKNNCLLYDPDFYTPKIIAKETQRNVNVNEQQLQNSLDFLLSTCPDSLDYYDSHSNTPLTLLAQDLSDWEEKFLDNYIEIPELVDILPEKTPFCTDTCYHFLQETTKNLKLFPTPPNSPSPCSKSSPENAKENDKSYPCEFGDCRKIYAKPAHLKAHLRRHLGEKPYICNWPDCTWRFSRSDELSRHRRSHSGVKPYKCDFCAKCFARSDHLTKHRKVHERRLQAARKAGKAINGVVPQSVLTVRPGRKRKNQF